jgi:hypothetical protein
LQGEIKFTQQFLTEHVKFMETTKDMIEKFMVNKGQFIVANSKSTSTHVLRIRGRVFGDL